MTAVPIAAGKEGSTEAESDVTGVGNWAVAGKEGAIAKLVTAQAISVLNNSRCILFVFESAKVIASSVIDAIVKLEVAESGTDLQENFNFSVSSAGADTSSRISTVLDDQEEEDNLLEQIRSGRRAHLSMTQI
jgi:precorrin-2 methylase